MKIVRHVAFSLIELLVVLTIVGVLAAIAVPFYRTYSVKAKIAGAVLVLENINHEIIKNLEFGKSISSSVNVNGTTFSNGANTTYERGNVMRAVYFNNASGIPSNSLLTCVRIKGLEGMIIRDGGSAYVAPTSTTDGVRDSMCMLTDLSQRPYKKYCGNWGTLPDLPWGNGYLPGDYLPPGCTCRNLGLAPACVP